MATFLHLAELLVSNVRMNVPITETAERLARGFEEELFKELKDESHKKAFWINIYNAYNKILITQEPDVLLKSISRLIHFTKRNINICGHYLSLNDIEHKILKGGKFWWLPLDINNPFHNHFIKNVMVNNSDYRVHFAINSNAYYNRPVIFYKPEKIDSQLEQNTIYFLNGDSNYDPVRNVVYISKIFKWNKIDFGSRSKILKVLKRYEIVPEESFPIIMFKDFDWQQQTESMMYTFR